MPSATQNSNTLFHSTIILVVLSWVIREDLRLKKKVCITVQFEHKCINLEALIFPVI